MTDFEPATTPPLDIPESGISAEKIPLAKEEEDKLKEIISGAEDFLSTTFRHEKFTDNQKRLLLMLGANFNKKSFDPSDTFRLITEGKIQNLKEFNHRYSDYVTYEEIHSHTSVALLALWSKEGLDNQQRGGVLDRALITLKVLSAYAKPDNMSSLLLWQELSKDVSKNYPGLEKYLREDLLIQSLQFITPNQKRLRTVVDKHRDTRLIYPTEELKNISDSLDRTTNESEVVSTVICSTSPYLCSFGYSELGQKNLREMTEYLLLMKRKIDTLVLKKEARALCETVIARQLFHNNPNEELDGRFVETLLPEVQTEFEEYVKFRKKKPLWQDRLEIFKLGDRDNIYLQEKPERKVRVEVGVSTGLTEALSFLKIGNYYSLHDAFTGHGCTDLSLRARGENSVFLLATGTPDDPYPNYGSLRAIDRENFETVHYGDINFILKNIVLEERTSAVHGDSLPSSHLPVTGMENFDRLYQYHRSHGERDYVEVQCHGGLRPEDIEIIVLTPGYFEDIKDREVKSLRKAIETYWKENKIKERFGLDPPEVISKNDLPVPEET